MPFTSSIFLFAAALFIEDVLQEARSATQDAKDRVKSHICKILAIKTRCEAVATATQNGLRCVATNPLQNLWHCRSCAREVCPVLNFPNAYFDLAAMFDAPFVRGMNSRDARRSIESVSPNARFILFSIHFMRTCSKGTKSSIVLFDPNT